jgi:phospholipase/carboxylesterase
MMITLSGPSRPPVNGDMPACLVILLHGRGSDGEDLLDLKRFWGPLIPEAEFIAPNAPFPSDMSPTGNERVRVRDRDPASIFAGVSAAAPNLDAFISEELQERGLGESDAELVGYSGRLIGADLLGEQLRARPPVLLVHGTSDSRVPVEAMTEAEIALRAAGVPVETLACVGTEHAIDQEGLVRGGIFLHQVLANSAE